MTSVVAGAPWACLSPLEHGMRAGGGPSPPCAPLFPRPLGAHGCWSAGGAMARVLGVTVEQLDFRRAEVDGDVRPAPAVMTEVPALLHCAGTMRVGSYINNCPRPGTLQLIHYSWGRGPDKEDTTVISVCDVHEEPIAPWAKDPGPDIM